MEILAHQRMRVMGNQVAVYNIPKNRAKVTTAKKNEEKICWSDNLIYFLYMVRYIPVIILSILLTPSELLSRKWLGGANNYEKYIPCSPSLWLGCHPLTTLHWLLMFGKP
jgi:hypothetical protein